MTNLRLSSRQFRKSIPNCIVLFVFLFASISGGGAVSALSQADRNSIYNDTVWYKLGGNNPTGTTDDEDVPLTCGSVGGGTTTSAGSIERLMAAIAKHESGGNPKAYNSGGGAYGKYQMISATWDSRVGAYDQAAGTNFASQYAEATDAPEAVQDAVQYLYLVKESIRWNGSVFRIAVDQYYPVANTDYSWLDKVPYPQYNSETIREFANTMVDWFNSGNGTTIENYRAVAGFQAASAKTGQPKELWGINVPSPQIPGSNPPAGGTNVNTGASVPCSCSQKIVEMAKNYAWSTYRGSGYITLKPAYKTAIDAAVSKGEYTGGPPPGVDCGAYVMRVMRDSGADPEYNSSMCNTVCQKAYMDANPDLYENLGTKNSTAGLQPGDIAITADTHTYLYLGDQGYSGYNSASASQSTRAPMASSAYFIDVNGVPFTWYRLKCPQAQGGGT